MYVSGVIVKYLQVTYTLPASDNIEVLSFK